MEGEEKEQEGGRNCSIRDNHFQHFLRVKDAGVVRMGRSWLRGSVSWFTISSRAHCEQGEGGAAALSLGAAAG